MPCNRIALAPFKKSLGAVSHALLACSLLCAGAAFAKAPKKWKYSGEDHGIRFFFTAPRGAKGPIVLKLENTLSTPVEVSFRVMDTDWNKTFDSRLAPGEADSSLAYRPGDGMGVRYPFIDRVFLEQLGEPQGETAGLGFGD